MPTRSSAGLPSAIARVSHNLKSPVTALRLAAASLAAGNDGTLPRRAKATALLMERTAARLLRMIEIQLDASRVERRSRTATEMVSADVAGELQDVVDILAPLATLKRLSLTLQAPKRYTAQLNAGLISDIAFVLIDNAINYTKQGSVRVIVSEDQKQFALSVTDTGIGMRPGEAAKLFRPFQRGAAYATNGIRGTGLGLFLARQFAEAVGGQLTAESPGEGRGSTFTLRIPIKKSHSFLRSRR